MRPVRPEPRRRRGRADDERLLPAAVVVGRYCTPRTPDSGRPISRQSRVRRSVRPSRRTSQKLFAERKIRLPPRLRVLDQVELVLGHVLGVAREDDEVVEPDQLFARRDRLEVGLGDDVRRLPGLEEPAEEVDVVLAPLRRRRGGCTPVRGRPCSARLSRTRCRPSRFRPRRGSCTPAMCLSASRPRPGSRRRGSWPDDERCVADPSIVRGQLDEVDARSHDPIA